MVVHYDAYRKHGSFIDHAGWLRPPAVAYTITGWMLETGNAKLYDIMGNMFYAGDATHPATYEAGIPIFLVAENMDRLEMVIRNYRSN